MIDKIVLSPSVHITVGVLVLVFTLAAAVVAGWQLWQRQSPSRASNGLLVATQLVLMAQALVGIKLLDQGLGALQLYIHYVGGLTPLFLLILLYWLPLRGPRTRAWATFVATAAAFVFAFMAFTIGQAYVHNPSAV